MSNPIWKSSELESWCRGFDYENYCYWCKDVSGVPPVSKHFYYLLCDLFEANMEHDMEQSRKEINGET